MAEAQDHLEQLSSEFQKHQKDLSAALLSRQKLEAQKEENLSVQKEFGLLGEGETIYKLVGPVLIKQEKAESEATVKGRLDFIGSEITRSEAQLKEVQDSMEKVKGEIVQIQVGARRAEAAQGKGKAGA